MEIIGSRKDRGVEDHAYGSLDHGEITRWNDSWWLIANTTIESSWAPVDKLNGSLGLDGGEGCVGILLYEINSVHEAACQVFSWSWITLSHHKG